MYYLKKFQDFYEENFSENFSDLKKDVASKFIDYIEVKSGERSINSYVNFLRSYNSFLIEDGFQKNMVVDISLRKKTESKYEKKEITDDQVQMILVNAYANDGIKNYTILSIAAYTGLRASEICSLKTSDAYLSDRIIKVAGNHERQIFIDSKVYLCLKSYFETVSENQVYLFEDEREMHYTERGLYYILEKNCDVFHVTFKQLREFYKTRLKNQGFTEKEINKILGLKTKGKSYEDITLGKMLSTSEAAKKLNISQWTVIKWCNNGKIRCMKTKKGFRRIPISEIERILKYE